MPCSKQVNKETTPVWNTPSNWSHEILPSHSSLLFFFFAFLLKTKQLENVCSLYRCKLQNKENQMISDLGGYFYQRK